MAFNYTTLTRRHLGSCLRAQGRSLTGGARLTRVHAEITSSWSNPRYEQRSRKLRVFNQADTLVLDIYKLTQSFPREEMYGLRAQMRRAAVSTPTNIVEGCARRGEKEYLNFLNMAVGSASETRYLVDLSHRLGFLKKKDMEELDTRGAQLIAGLVQLIASIENNSPA